jgi:hypothetical protein
MLTAVAVASLAVPSMALANSSVIGNPTGITSTVKGTIQGGANNSTQQYKTAYTDNIFGPVACAGVHIQHVGQPAKESWTCTSTTGHPLTWNYFDENGNFIQVPAVTPGLSLNLVNVRGWWSDFDWTQNLPAGAKTYVGQVSADGMSYTSTATY